MKLISWLKNLLVSDRRTPFQRGYQMAWTDLVTCAADKRLALAEHLEALASGGFNTKPEHYEFDRGVDKAVSDWRRINEST